MRHHRLIWLLAAAVFVFALTTGSAAATVPGTALPLAGFSQMVVDGAHGHVFVTGSPSDSTIVVLNEDGTSAGTITGESGAGGMVLDGQTLYVARCGWGVIDEIDTATLAKTGSFSAPVGGTCDLAEAGGVLWFSDSTDQQWGNLDSVTLDSSHTVVDSGRNLYQMIFATTPAHPSWLVVGEAGLDPSSVDVYDVSDPSQPSLLGSSGNLNGGGNLRDIAVTPDGATLLVASGAPYEIDGFALPGLTGAGVYPTDNYPDAVAVSPSGTMLAGGSESYYSNDVFLFNSGNATATARWDFGGTSDLLYARGLAFSSDGTRLFAVSAGQSGSAVVFHVVPTVVLPKGSVSVKTSAQTVLAGHALTVTAHLGTASSNRTVSIYRKPVNGTRTLVKTGTVGAKGNLSVTVHPTATTSYTAVWSGDASHAQTTSAAVTTKVRLVVHAATKGGYRTSLGVRLYHYQRSCAGSSHTGCPTFLTSSTPLLPGHQVNIVVQARISGRWRTLLTGSQRTGSTGKLTIIVYYNGRAVIGVPQRIRFTYPKDAAHLGNTSAWVRYRVTS